jgi:hypothetical protein
LLSAVLSYLSGLTYSTFEASSPKEERPMTGSRSGKLRGAAGGCANHAAELEIGPTGDLSFP